MPWVSVDQLSLEWLHMRCGCPSASHMADIMAYMKRQKDNEPRKEKSERRDYRIAKVAEYLTGRSMDTFVSRQMEEGIEREPLARAEYEMQNDCEVLPGGLYFHDGIKQFVASPDGRVGDDGLIEIKCLQDHNHIELVASGEIPEKFQLQMHAQLACSGRQWVDFVAFNPYMPDALKLWVKRFPRDDKWISIVELEVKQFLEEMIALSQQLQKTVCV